MKLEFLPVKLRLPLKFGGAEIDSLLVAHVELDAYGATGRGETPLSVEWAWPGKLGFSLRENAMRDFCTLLSCKWPTPDSDPLTSGYRFLTGELPELLGRFNRERKLAMPFLAALICASAFDIACHDAFGIAHGLPVYRMYDRRFLEHDLAWFYRDSSFSGMYPADFFVSPVPDELPVWHLVGGRDLLRERERTGSEPDDGYPVSLEAWIRRDGLDCLKIKLSGDDWNHDFARLVDAGLVALENGCTALSPDFNCRVTDPGYVDSILDELAAKHHDIFDRIVYVEQPFPRDLEALRLDVRSCAARKPLFMDESAHDWQAVKLGFELGWNGVALKVCKTQTGALLSACWAKQHGMLLMVQDLTNPLLAVIPHVQLAAHVGTIMGVECNAPQFCPLASARCEKLHPGLYERRNGVVRLDMLDRPGFGY